MKLTNRLTAFFLAGLALVLAGFAITLFLLARTYLQRHLDERLEAALYTLMAAAEIENGELEWDRHDRQLRIGGTLAVDAMQWEVHSRDGRLIDSSGESSSGLQPGAEASSNESAAGFATYSRDGAEWRCVRRALSVEASVLKGPSPSRYSALIFTVAASKRPVHDLLERISTALILIAITIWALALVAGRWYCRRALLPVAQMAAQARTMDGGARAERLRVPASRDELEILGQSFNGLLDRMHEALERQRRFTGDASHQLRTPLTALLGQVEVALRHPRTEEEYRHTLVQMRRQGDNLRQIVEMLLFLSRADAEAQLENLEPLDVNKWLVEHARGFSAHPRSRDFHLEIDVAGRCLVRAQPPLLGQLLDNLIENACQYSEDGESIGVRLRAENGRAILSVEDHGMGIAAVDLPHLFDPFYRSEAARIRVRTGIGLGLSVAHRIARLFGGELSVTSKVGGGSCFRVELPSLPDAAPDQAASPCK